MDRGFGSMGVQRLGTLATYRRALFLRGAFAAVRSLLAERAQTPAERASAAARGDRPALRAASGERRASASCRFVLAALAALCPIGAMAQASYQLPNAFVSGAAGRTGNATYSFPSGVQVTFTVAGNAVGTGDSYTMRNATGSNLGVLGSPTAAMFSPNVPPSTIRGSVIDAWGVGCPTFPAAGGSCPRGTLTVTFSRPVTNPILHFGGVGVSANAMATQYTLTSALNGTTPVAATMAVIRGNPVFAVSGSTVRNSNAPGNFGPTCTAAANSPGACGSVQFTGLVTTLTFDVAVFASGTNAGNNGVTNSEGHTLSASVSATTLQLAKAWAANSTAGDQVSIGATTGGANNTAAFNATAPTAANSGAAVQVLVGDTIVLPAEAGANAADYTTTVACTGGHTLSGTDGQQTNTLTITSGNPAVCTYTNTPRTTTLQLAKAWAANSFAGDQVTIGATTGGTNNTAAFNATAPTAANSGAAVRVRIGDTITLPAETGAALGNYTTTVACTGGHTLSGTDGQQTNTLTITGTNPAVCTYTNTPSRSRLTLRKVVVNNDGANAVATAWTLTATGPTTISGTHGAAAVTNAMVGPGTYTLTETGGPAGYAASPYSCVVNGAAAVEGNQLALAAGDVATCTITNDDLPLPRLTVRKITLGGAGSFEFAYNPGGIVRFITVATQSAGPPGAEGTFNPGPNAGAAGFVFESTLPNGWDLTGLQCTVTRPDGTTVPGAGTVSVATRRYTLSRTDTARGNQILCTFTNSRRPTLRVTKISNGGTGRFVFTGSNGVANHGITTTADGGAGTVGAQQILTTAGAATRVTETVPAGWRLTGASCTVTPDGGASAPAAGSFDAATASFNLTAADTAVGNAIACTFTNQRQATLQLAKAWAANARDGDIVSIGASSGGANNTVAFNATAPTAANSGAPVAVNVGDTVTLPAEAGTNAANYTTALACTGGHTLSGTDGQQSNTLTITSGTAAVCTYTNTLRTADLSITKTNTPAAGAQDQAGDIVVRTRPTTYSLVVNNRGQTDVTGAVVRDTAQSGLDCPVGNPVTCTGAACPAGAISVGDLTGAGVTLGLLAAGGSATLSFTCTVQ